MLLLHSKCKITLFSNFSLMLLTKMLLIKNRVLKIAILMPKFETSTFSLSYAP